MEKYYISPFDFFYAKNEELGKKFCKSAFDGCYTMESDDFDLNTVLQMIAKGFEENEDDFENAHINILDLVSGVVKRKY